MLNEEQGRELANIWELAKYRNDELTHLFGPATDKLPIVVSVHINTFQHVFTEDFTYGILAGIGDIPDIQLSFMDIAFTRKDLFDEWQLRNRYEYRYNVQVRDYNFPFNTPDFIQGATTAALWLNVDPHTIISDLVEGQPRNETKLDF